jgi:hypothetical protein
VNCSYEKTPDGKLWKCQRKNCGHETLVRPHHKAAPRRQNCGGAKSAYRCQYLGSLDSEKECDSCQGKVRIKLFACAVHGQCSIGKALHGIATCSSCQDYSPNKRDGDPDSGVAG